MAAAGILDFQILLADGVGRAQMHHSAKCRQNRSFRCGDIAIFLIFKMSPPPSLILEIMKFYWLTGSRGLRLMIMPTFIKIGQSVAKILRFFDFSR